MIEFISYSGGFPNLCRGELKLRINGEERIFPPGSLKSGGETGPDEDWDGWIASGRWQIDLPEDLEQMRDEIEEVINNNIPEGCCGGCI